MELSRAAAHLPSNVARFEQLMYLSVGLGLVEVASDWNEFTADIGNIGGVRVAVFAVLYLFAFFVLLIWQAAREHQKLGALGFAHHICCYNPKSVSAP